MAFGGGIRVLWTLFLVVIYFYFIFQIKSSTPVLMCSVPGYDASSRVDDLAAEMSKQITSIAIGEL